MPKFTKIERPSTPREAYELLRSSKTARYGGGGLWMRLQHRTIPCAIDLSACGLDQIEESDDAFVIGAMTPLSVLESHADLPEPPTASSRRRCAISWGPSFATSRPWAVACTDVLAFRRALRPACPGMRGQVHRRGPHEPC